MLRTLDKENILAQRITRNTMAEAFRQARKNPMFNPKDLGHKGTGSSMSDMILADCLNDLIQEALEEQR